jgi:predicted DNA-binding protein
LPIIKPSGSEKRVIRSFRLKKKLDDKLNEITKKTGETKTYVLESLLEYAIKEWEKKDGKNSTG